MVLSAYPMFSLLCAYEIGILTVVPLDSDHILTVLSLHNLASLVNYTTVFSTLVTDHITLFLSSWQFLSDFFATWLLESIFSHIRVLQFLFGPIDFLFLDFIAGFSHCISFLGFFGCIILSAWEFLFFVSLACQLYYRLDCLLLEPHLNCYGGVLGLIQYWLHMIQWHCLHGWWLGMSLLVTILCLGGQQTFCRIQQSWFSLWYMFSQLLCCLVQALCNLYLCISVCIHWLVSGLHMNICQFWPCETWFSFCETSICILYW